MKKRLPKATGLHQKTVLGIIFLLFLLSMTNYTLRSGGETEEKPDAKEFVDVVNVEMTVRALKKGRPVSGLTASDFRMTENGKPINITGFFEVHRKIGQREDIQLEEGDDIRAPRKKRLFLFYFWVQEKRVKYRESLDYFFNNIYQEGDRVIFAHKNRAIQISKPEDIDPAMISLDRLIQSASDEWRRWVEMAAQSQQNKLDAILRELSRNPPDWQQIRRMMDILYADLQANWREYRYKYLTSNSKKLMDLAATLKKIPFEKWGIVIYQPTPFPLLDVEKLKALGANILVPGIRKFYIQSKVPPFGKQRVLPLQQAFISANATFHMLVPGYETNLEAHTPDMRLTDVYSGWENTFREITAATGGQLVTGNILKTSMQKVKEREDVFYRITYKPHSMTKKKRKIRIQTRDKSLTVFHVSRIKVEKPKEIQLANVTLNDSILELTLKNYLLVNAVDEGIADLQLIVSVTNKDGESMEYMKKLELRSEEAVISMKLKLPANEPHTLLVTVWDNYSGLKAQKTVMYNQ